MPQALKDFFKILLILKMRRYNGGVMRTKPETERTTMACMEHECCECGHVWFDNSMNRECPVCGSKDTTRHFDEE